VSVGIGSLIVAMLKESIDRARPEHADPTINAAVATPDSPSFPSGHTATAFAAAAVVSAFYPRLRWPLYSLAALVGLSRIYLGVHFTLDVVAGAILGLSIGLSLVWVGRKGRALLQARRARA
jgi:undecaprenyl-diphosphatase